MLFKTRLSWSCQLWLAKFLEIWCLGWVEFGEMPTILVTLLWHVLPVHTLQRPCVSRTSDWRKWSAVSILGTQLPGMYRPLFAPLENPTWSHQYTQVSSMCAGLQWSKQWLLGTVSSWENHAWKRLKSPAPVVLIQIDLRCMWARGEHRTPRPEHICPKGSMAGLCDMWLSTDPTSIWLHRISSFAKEGGHLKEGVLGKCCKQRSL